MKVLLIDPLGCAGLNLGFQMKSALEAAGHTVIPFNYRWQKLQHISFTNQLLNNQMITRSKGVDMVLVNKGETMLKGTVQKIRKRGVPVAIWCPDEPFGELQGFNKLVNIDEYDAFFCYDKNYIGRIKKINPKAFHLPPAADPFGVHKEQIPLESRTLPHDVALVGTAYPNRIELLEHIKTYKLAIAGPAWQKAPPYFASTAKPAVNETGMTSIFNSAKIVLNPYGASPFFLIPNPRTFEIPATRSFQLTDKDVSDYFVSGKEIVIYTSTKDFVDLITYYTIHDKERNKIAQAGYDRVVKEHTMKHRILSLLETMKILKLIR